MTSALAATVDAVPVRGKRSFPSVPALLVLLVAACGATGVPPSTAPAPSPSEADAGATDEAVPTTVACQQAPLEARAATVLALGIGNATTADHPVARQVAGLGVGAVLLLGANVVDAAQVRTLIDDLHQQAPNDPMMAVDEEGGRVSRLRPIIGSTPSARQLGRRPLSEITAVARERGSTLAGLGLDLILAPVVDADDGPRAGAIGDRSFSAVPAEAGERAAAFAIGLSEAGVLAVAKHFPGQGELADSHDGAVVSGADQGEIERVAAAGFGPAVAAGIPAVMMSHVTFPTLGPGPASLEPEAYRLLRSLGFAGVAMTDAVNMSAVSDQRPLAEAAMLALAAGADLVLATPGAQATEMRDAVVAAVSDGRLDEARLDEAVGRVLNLGGKEASTMVCR